MKTFSLDFASHEGHLACVDGDHVLALKIVSRVNDADFVSLAESVLSEAGWKISDIERIACNVGPGGFTSVRGGVTFANALADQLDLPIAGFHGSALMIARGNVGASCMTPLPFKSANAFWIHSTRTDQVFICGGPWSEPTLVTLADAVASIQPGTTIVGDLMDAHRDALVAAGAVPADAKPLEAVLPVFLAGLDYGKKSLVPWYGRGI